MRTEGHVRNVAVYSIIGINLEGIKECLGLWICETESAKYWLSVLNELKNRGLVSQKRSRLFSPELRSRNALSIRFVTPCVMSPGKSERLWPRT